jgi:hypothetical protein
MSQLALLPILSFNSLSELCACPLLLPLSQRQLFV